MYLIRGSVGALSFIFTHPPEDLKKKKIVRYVNYELNMQQLCTTVQNTAWLTRTVSTNTKCKMKDFSARRSRFFVLSEYSCLYSYQIRPFWRSGGTTAVRCTAVLLEP